MSYLSLVDISVDDRLDKVTCQVEKGTVVHVLGENGAGKSTALLVISGLLAFASGEVFYQRRKLKGISLSELATFRCFHQQGVQPVFDLHVDEYLSFYRLNKVDIPQKLEQAFEIQHLLRKSITALSGGELQRIELCRSLIQVWPAIESGQALLIFDEPLQALDIRHQLSFLTLTRQLAERGNTLLLSSHHIDHSARYADLIWCFQNGKLIAQGGADEIITPHILERTYQCQFDVKESGNSWQIDALRASDPR
ncbi:ATP-binding cassette domain-containing protein [Alteromonas sp. ASW11-130]|uniref:ATP-binding cassette domain-containing protein n=1 Tax=Alteromonas sp. ASW11-130 TaxID=3015775 RepID=UPI002242BEF2|nr:ATP-binding cassette domain-containing protein [Alteromonas sp. ASW11-130]MCW8091372.1 ATP-binding cassette domain-containing protein [Alteromonas sp. ASW11-130]